MSRIRILILAVVSSVLASSCLGGGSDDDEEEGGGWFAGDYEIYLDPPRTEVTAGWVMMVSEADAAAIQAEVAASTVEFLSPAKRQNYNDYYALIPDESGAWQVEKEKTHFTNKVEVEAHGDEGATIVIERDVDATFVVVFRLQDGTFTGIYLPPAARNAADEMYLGLEDRALVLREKE